MTGQRPERFAIELVVQGVDDTGAIIEEGDAWRCTLASENVVLLETLIEEYGNLLDIAIQSRLGTTYRYPEEDPNYHWKQYAYA